MSKYLLNILLKTQEFSHHGLTFIYT